MTRMVVLFNLREGVNVEDYERWAREQDAVAVRGLPSIDDFRIIRIAGAMSGESPYQYVELVQINDMDQFAQDVAGEEMTRIAGEFQRWAENPTFIHGQEIA